MSPPVSKKTHKKHEHLWVITIITNKGGFVKAIITNWLHFLFDFVFAPQLFKEDINPLRSSFRRGVRDQIMVPSYFALSPRIMPLPLVEM